MSHDIALPTDIDVPKTSLWAKLPMIGGALAVIGLGTTLAASGGELKARAMFSYLWAFEYCLSLALGGLAFTLLEHVTRAGWSASVRRIGETAMATLPFFIILWIPIATVGFHDLYPWTHEHDALIEKKRWFLSNGFFLGRGVAYLAIWSVLAFVLHRSSAKQDSLKEGPERERLTRLMWRVSAAGVLLYGLTQSLQAIDWMMSLQPHWYSTIYGVYYFAGSILSFFAFCALVVMGLQKAGVLSAVTTEHFHDLGKYAFGFTVFWAYIAFSQFILIWYANIPEETIFYMVRLSGGWELISYALPLIHFLIPFALLMSRHVKRSRRGLGYAAVWVLLVHAVDLYWNIMPNFGSHGEGMQHSTLAPNWTDAAAFIGMAGAFLAVFSFFLTRNKVICIGDPRLQESLAHENY